MRLAIFAAALPQMVFAAPQPLFEPATKWVVDYGNQRCTLSRKFVAGKREVTLVFEKSAPRRSISILAFGNGVKAKPDRDNELAFAPLADVIIRDGSNVRTREDKQTAVYWEFGLPHGKWGLISGSDAVSLAQRLPPDEIPYWVPGYKPKPIKWEDRDFRDDDAATKAADDQAFYQRAAAIQMVVLNPKSVKVVSLNTGQLSGPLKALETCAVDSLKFWGIDPAVEATVATRPHPLRDPSKLMSDDDYPPEAIRLGKESSIELWLNISATGQITKCRMISTYYSPEINDRMCTLTHKRQQFVPAKNAAGQAVPSYYIQSFKFRIQG